MASLKYANLKRAALVAGILSAPVAAPALAQTAPAPVNEGGIASVTNSTVGGATQGLGVLNSTVTASGLGTFNKINPYGGTTDITATIAGSRVSLQDFGVAQVSGSTLAGPASALSINGSVLDQSGAGIANNILGVGTVSQVSATLKAAPVVNSGVLTIDTSTVTGPADGTAVLASLGSVAAFGTGNTINPFGGYGSLTVTTKPVLPSGSTTAGAAFITGSTLGKGVSGTLAQGSVVSQSGAGLANTVDPVGPVSKVTFTAQKLGLQ